MGGGGRGGRGGGMGGFGGSEGNKPYNLTLSINASNVLNINNKGVPVGNMNSNLFGTVNSSGGGSFGFFGGGGGGNSGQRRINLSMRFSW